MTLSKDDFVYATYSELKNWLFNDLSFVFTSRKLTQIKNTDLPHINADDDDEVEDRFVNLRIFGFRSYNLDFIVAFSKELVAYLETIFGKDVPFEHIIILVSDKSTKIESIGNILILNDLEFNQIDQSPTSLIYTSLTVSLFFARIYFGNIITYVSPEEKFVVEGVRGTLALLFLQNSRVLDSELQDFSKGKVRLEKIIQVDDMSETEAYKSVLDEDINTENSSRTNANSHSNFLNESILSHRSTGQPDRQREMLEINDLLNLYLVDMKYKNFEIELSHHTNPLYDSNTYFNKETLESITYNNSLAKFKMYYVLKELKIPTCQFIKAFRLLVKSYSNECISSQIFIEFMDEQLSDDKMTSYELQDWFMYNFEKTGINKISYEIVQKDKRLKIKHFKLIQSDMCMQNKSNPVLRKHTTDILLLNADLEPAYHFDIAIDDKREEMIKELVNKNMPKAVILNASENGYYYGSFSETDVTVLLDKLDRLKSEVYRYKLFKHLLLNNCYIDFLDYAPQVVADEKNYILLEFILKTSANLIESIFPSKCYMVFDEIIVNEAESMKIQFSNVMLKRILAQNRKENKGIAQLLISYLPHFMCCSFKHAREILSVIEKQPLDDLAMLRYMIEALLERYFVFHNVDMGEKQSLVKYVCKSEVLNKCISEDQMTTVCDEYGDRLINAKDEFIFDTVYKVNLKYNRVITNDGDYAFLMQNIKNLCNARIDENIILDIFPLNYVMDDSNSCKRLTVDLIGDLDQRGMFDYSSIIAELYDKMTAAEKLYKDAHRLIIQAAQA